MIYYFLERKQMQLKVSSLFMTAWCLLTIYNFLQKFQILKITIYWNGNNDGNHFPYPYLIKET